MSYILNALRKSERERQAVEPNAITDRIVVEHSPRHRASTKWIVALIVVNMAILVYFLGFAHQETPVDSELVAAKSNESPSIANRTSTGVSDNHSTFKKKSDRRGIASSGSSNTGASAVAHKQRAVEANKPTVINKTAELKNSNSAAKGVIPALPPDIPKKVESSQPAESVKSEQQVVPNKNDVLTTEAINDAPEQTQSLPEQSTLPFLDELPWEFQRELPTLPINVFSYSTDVNERFVMVDMVKYVQGQRIKDLLEIKEIRSDGIVVSYKGRTFVIRRP